MLALRIALRYFFSAKSHGAVNVISGISVAGVAVSTAAIVIVLSVFNGFTSLTKSRFSTIDPDLMAVPHTGKVFRHADSIASEISRIAGVEAAVPTLSDRGLVMTSDNSQLGVVFKGVAEGYDKIADFQSITELFNPSAANGVYPPASVSVGVASQLDVHAGLPVELYTLRRIGRINPANPAGAFFSEQFAVERVLQVNQPEFDADHIIIPLESARQLLQYHDDEASAIEIRLARGADAAEIASAISKRLDLNVLTKEQQHSEAYKMIAVEKWVTFAMLIFILIISAFNIVSTLSLMIIEKRDNMATLGFLGATRGTVTRIFETMGAMITVVGGVIGIIVGVALSLAQQYGGFVKLGGDPANLSVTSYPVRVEGVDILIVGGIVAVVAVLASLTTRIFTHRNNS